MTTNIIEIYTQQKKFEMNSEEYDERVLRNRCDIETASRDLDRVEDLLKEKEIAYIKSIRLLSEKKKSLEDEIKSKKYCLPPTEILEIQELINRGSPMYQIALSKEELISFGVNEVDFTTTQTLLKGTNTYTDGFQSRPGIYWQWTDYAIEDDLLLYRRFIHDATRDDGDFNIIAEFGFLDNAEDFIDTLIVDNSIPIDGYITSYTTLYIRKFTKA